ncbi:hypothetical protein BDQ17DRAFT_1440990 [Cyathus striatus]|nr:hypothetical protein BDQ17DRAFT_1440990 [Cyathus striatus]
MLLPGILYSTARECKPSPFAEEDCVVGKFVKEEEGERVDVPEEELKVFEELIGKMELRELDLPLVALSNGQMRHARIIKAVLIRPDLLLLDEPLTALDTLACPLLLTLLHQLHESHAPRIILGLRTQDVISGWIMHAVVVRVANLPVFFYSEGHGRFGKWLVGAIDQVIA